MTKHCLIFYFLIHTFFLSAQTGTITVTSISNTGYCDGTPIGAVDLTVEGGYAPYTFMWDGPDSYSESTEDITNLSNGNYCVTVTDKLCGNAELCVTVKCEKSCPKIDLDDLEAAINHPSECDASDGNIYFRSGGPSGGAPPYTIIIYDEEGNLVPRTGQSWSGLSVGQYTLVVEDANGCKGGFEAILLPEDGGVYLTSEFYPACEGQMNGRISVTERAR